MRPPVSAISGAAGVEVIGHRAADDLRGFGGAGEGDPLDPGVRGQRGTDGRTIAGQQLQNLARNTRLVQQLDGEGGDQRGLLRRFRKNSVASSQRRRDLAGEDGEREVPRRNAGEEASGWGRQRFGLIRVVAQEIDRFAQFTHAVDLDFSGLAAEDREKFAEMRFV